MPTGDDGEEAGEPAPAVLQLPQQLDPPEEVRAAVKAQWDALQAMVEDLRPIERFRVVGIAFRRWAHLPARSLGSSRWKLPLVMLGYAQSPVAWLLFSSHAPQSLLLQGPGILNASLTGHRL